jgi:acyl carrier protein
MDISEVFRSAQVAIPPRFQFGASLGNVDTFETCLLEELELDSLALQELSIQIFLHFGVELSSSEIGAFTSVADLARKIKGVRGRFSETDFPFKGSRIKNEFPRSPIQIITPGEVSLKYILRLYLSGLRQAGTRIISTTDHFYHASWLRTKGELRDFLFLRKRLEGFNVEQKKWHRSEIVEGLQLYWRRPKKAGLPGLTVVGFSGTTGRLMMPVSLFLSALPSTVSQVLLVQAPTQVGYRGGILGGPSSLQGGLEMLQDFLRSEPMLASEGDRLAVIGTSAGAIPAFVFSTLYSKPFACLLAGPQSPFEPNWSNNNLLRAALERRAENVGECFEQVPRVLVLYGEKSQLDLGRLPTWDAFKPQIIRGIERAGHGVLFPLLERGHLSTVFDEWLGSDGNQ